LLTRDERFYCAFFIFSTFYRFLILIIFSDVVTYVAGRESCISGWFVVLYCVVCQDQYGLLYEAMSEYLGRPGAYELGPSDCRAFPPTSPQSGAPAVTWAVTSPPASHGNRQVRVSGPWRTPDPLGTPPDRAAWYRPAAAAGPAVTGGRRETPAGSSFWAAPWRQSDDAAELNVSMNRAASDGEPATTNDDKQHLMSSPSAAAAAVAAAVESQSSFVNSTPLTAADEHAVLAGEQTRGTVDDRRTTVAVTSSAGLREAQSSCVERPGRETVSPLLTSTPLDHNSAPVVT